MQPVIYADLRCLQDENYRIRGIGLHVAALLRTRAESAFATHKVIGLVDPQLPALLPEFAPLFDEITGSTNPSIDRGPAIFLDGSPMGHDSKFTACFMNRPDFLRAAVIYDFIQLDWPGYLPTVTSRIDYLGKLARLRKFDFLLPISHYTARRAHEILGIPHCKMVVTGASVRRSIHEFRDRHKATVSPYDRPDPYFFAIYGGDPRKNIETAIKAVRHLNLVYGRRIPLKVAGHYDLKVSGHYNQAWKRKLLRLAGHTEHRGFLEFCPLVSDEELVTLYSGAIATIVPSYIEGFSLPVAEAAACGCPGVVSACDAHLELVEQPEALFESDDVAALCGKLDALLENPSLRESLKAAQSHLASRFHESAVGEVFWGSLERLASKQVRSVAVRKKPRLAFLTPFPPDPSDAGIYTALAIRAGEKLFDSDIYTSALRPLALQNGARDAGEISIAPLFSGQYRVVVSVLGTDMPSAPALGIFQRYGGPCIVHDTSLLAELAARRGAPLIVHTAAQQVQAKMRYGVDAEIIPCCPTTLLSSEELTPVVRQAVRERRGIAPGSFVISAFGDVSRGNRMQNCISALDLLRSWGVPAELHFVGHSNISKSEVDRIAAVYEITAYVHYEAGFAGSPTYRDFLIASDAAIQLRSDAFGQLSVGLIDCIGAGLACVATQDLIASLDAPSYVAAIPERYSPLHLAEQLASIWEARAPRDSHTEARFSYVQSHNFEQYAARLAEILNIG